MKSYSLASSRRMAPVSYTHLDVYKRQGRIEVRNDRLGNLHAVIGKASFDDGRLGENFAALMDAIVRAKPPAAKGTYLKTVTLCTTHGPAIKVDPAQASKLQVA